MRVANVRAVIQSDIALTPENRQLALDMVNHFIEFGSTMCRNCGLGWGIYMLADAIIVITTFGGGTYIGAIIVLLIGVGLLSCWASIASRDHRSAAALQERETAALSTEGGAILVALPPT
jgi:hypothetical protein